MLSSLKRRKGGFIQDAPVRVLVALLVGAACVATYTSRSFAVPTRRATRPWMQPTITRRVCDNTCPKARDGVCDEGRPPRKVEPGGDPALIDGYEPPKGYYAVRCDLGTDCDDCGPWEFEGIASALTWSPVADLMARDIELRAQHVDGTLNFVMPYTDPAVDVDVSNWMTTNGKVEPGFTSLWLRLLAKGCRPGGADADHQPSSRSTSFAAMRRNDGETGGLVLDVGANFGWFSFLSASMGCRVISWEPVPHFASFFKYGLLRNGMTSRVDLRESIVSDVNHGNLTIVVPNRGIWGTAGVDGANLDPNVPNEGEYERIVKPVETVDSVVEETEGEILIMKADVEGFEPFALRGSRELFKTQRVVNLIMEYSPGVPERVLDWPKAKEQPVMLYNLIKSGYRIFHIGFADMFLFSGTVHQRLPDLPEISGEILEHDVNDAKRMGTAELGCPLPKEAQNLTPGLWSCGNMPEGLHPHSFRATFGHNTNLWIRRDSAADSIPTWVTIDGMASLFPLEYSLKKNFFTPHSVGMGGRPCSGLNAENSLAHRCPCPDKEICGEAEATLMRLAKEGKLAPAA